MENSYNEYKDDEVISLKKVIVDYARQWRLFLTVFAISLIPAVLYLVLYPRTYEAFALVRLQEDSDMSAGGSIGLGEAAGLMRSFGLGSGMKGTLIVDDEIAAFQSNRLLSRVAVRLGLDVDYRRPLSFVRYYRDDTPLTITPDSALRRNIEKTIKLSVKKQGQAVEVKEIKSGKVHRLASLPGTIDLGIGTITLSQPSNGTDSDAKMRVSIMPAGWVAERLAKEVLVEEYSKAANTLELTYTDHNKLRGREVLDCLIDEYNKSASVEKHDEGGKNLAFLDTRIRDVLAQLAGQEQQIEQYKLKNNMTEIEYDVQFYTEAIKNYREKIIELEAQGHVLNMLEEYVKDPANKYSVVPAMLTSASESEGGAVSLYNAALLEREKLLATTKGNNPLSLISEKQLDKLRGGVYVSISNARESVARVMDDLKKKENEILSKMGNVPVYEREYVELKRQQEILQGVYLVLLQKKEEIALSLGSDRDRGFSTDPAYVKMRPVAPRKLFAAIFIMLFTAVVPVVYLFCKEQLSELVKEYKRR